MKKLTNKEMIFLKTFLKVHGVFRQKMIALFWILQCGCLKLQNLFMHSKLEKFDTRYQEW